MNDIWVCGTCHSINRRRAGHCYGCGAAQVTAATGEMSTVRQEQAILNRTVVAYRPAAALGLGAALFLLGLAVVSIAGIVDTIGLSSFLDTQFDGVEATGRFDDAAITARLTESGRLGLVSLAIVLPALLFFGLWLGRVVANVPALGGGLPRTTPTRAFVSTLIPILNLRTVPGIVQDVLYRLDPTGGGIFMVGIAWVGLVGSWILSFAADKYLQLRITFDAFNATSVGAFVSSIRQLLTAAVVIDVITGALIAIGAIVLVMLIVRVERRSRARDREIRAFAGV